MESTFAATSDAAWTLEDRVCDPLLDTSRASRFAVSNGFLGVRCSLESTYVAGLFDTAGGDAPISALVPAINWLHLRIAETAGDPLETGPLCIVLDMRRGMVVTSSSRTAATACDLEVRTLHFVSLKRRAIGLQMAELRCLRGTTDLTLYAAVDGNGTNLVPLSIDRTVGTWRTGHSGKALGVATKASLKSDGTSMIPASIDSLKSSWRWTASAGQTVTFDRTLAFVKNNVGLLDTGIAAQEELDAATRAGCSAIVAEHEAAWARRWDESDVVVDGDARAQQALRFAVYHLNSAVDPDDEHVSIGARALTGADYNGHVFWDTEIYLVPFYMMTWPQAARALLMYRFHTLCGAREKAARMGWRGALYAWESADTGEETAPQRVVGPDRQLVEILSGTLEQHISADVAYAVWQYWLATNDEEFFSTAGAEILLETGRFWASRATLERDGLRHIRNVVGPDEYHEHVDDNAFTNVMARWNIRRALDAAELLQTRWPQRWAKLSAELALDGVELESWHVAAETIVTGFDHETGLFEQFAGYFRLEEIDLAAYAGRSVPMDVVLGRERTGRSQVIKQADVVALLALLPEEFPGTSAATNFRYYASRCDHGSSLSRAIHALAATRIGEGGAALQYFTDTAAIDLRDTHVAIGGGVHIAAQGGVWLAAVFGFSGLSIRDDGIALAPRIPASWKAIHYRVRWRGRRIKIDIVAATRSLVATLEDGEPMSVRVDGIAYDLCRDAPLSVRTTTTGT